MSTVTMDPISKPTYRVGPRNGFKNESLIEVPDMHVTDDLLVDGDMEVTGTLYCTLLTSGVTISATDHLTADITVDAGVDITAAAGADNFDYTLSTGTFDSPTGTNHLNGDVTIATGKTFTTSAGAVALNGDVTVATGKDILMIEDGTGTFFTGAGAVHINGDTTLAADKHIVAATGSGHLDFSAATGAFLTSTGANTLSGSSLAISGDVTIGASADMVITSGDSKIDLSGGSGIFKTTTGAVTIGPGAVGITGDIAITANKNLIMGTAGSGTGEIKTGTGAIALNGTTTIATAKTLVVTDADKLTVGGYIVPQKLVITKAFDAASVDEWVFVADAGYMLETAELVYTVKTTAGSTSVDIVKSTSVQAPASGATMLTGTIALDGTANTVYAGTAHGTDGNKSLADGNKMGLNYTGDLTGLVGGVLTIVMHRVA